MEDLEKAFASTSCLVCSGLQHDEKAAADAQQCLENMTQSNESRRNSIVQVIHAFVLSERRSNFAFLGRYSHVYMNGEDLSISVAAQEDINLACARWSSHPSDLSDCTWMTFHQNLTGLTDTVPLRCTSQATELTVECLQVCDIDETKSWMNVCTWMRKKLEWRDSYEWNWPQLQLEEQKIWWRVNGKAFRLLDLPRELRDAIYLEIIGPVIDLNVRPFSSQLGSNLIKIRLTLGERTTPKRMKKGGTNLGPELEPSGFNIWRVSRQVHGEVFEMARRQATKRFHMISPRDLCEARHGRSAVQMLTLAPPAVLTHLQLEFSAAAYFRFIGIRPFPGDPFAKFIPDDICASIHTLKAIRTIRMLDLRFISSKHPCAICPWGILQPPENRMHSCQKRWIDWFLTFALEHLRQCSFKVTMSGCIKNSTRGKWERILEQERKGFEQDMALRKEAIRLSKTCDEPIKCECLVPCYNQGVDLWSSSDDEELRGIAGLQQEMEQRDFSFLD